jgi:hypothetical protein
MNVLNTNHDIIPIEYGESSVKINLLFTVYLFIFNLFNLEVLLFLLLFFMILVYYTTSMFVDFGFLYYFYLFITRG